MTCPSISSLQNTHVSYSQIDILFSLLSIVNLLTLVYVYVYTNILQYDLLSLFQFLVCILFQGRPLHIALENQSEFSSLREPIILLPSVIAAKLVFCFLWESMSICLSYIMLLTNSAIITVFFYEDISKRDCFIVDFLEYHGPHNFSTISSLVFS